MSNNNVWMERLVAAAHGGTALSLRALRFWAWPKTDFLIRVWLAKIFLISGLLKLMNWQTALYLATYEYPVHGLSPQTAAYLGVSIETLGGVLLALGFMTRYAALPLLLLSLVIQVTYRAFDSQLFWMALFGWYLVHGAGPVSIDHLMRRGLGDSALPLVPRIIAMSTLLRSRGTPVYLTGLRLWLGLALLIASPNSDLEHLPSILHALLPLDLAARVPSALAQIGGALLVSGLGTRVVAAALGLTLFADSMMDPRTTDAVYLLMVFAILVSCGGGALALDRIIFWALQKRAASINRRDPRQLQGLPRVVIVGAGFGGLSCAAGLRNVRAAVTLINRTNYHLFQPLLYQVATSALSESDIAIPARQLFRDAFGTRVLLGTVTGVDAQRHVVKLDQEEIGYDYLVLATGATHSYFGKDAWAPHAPGLKGIEDAVEIRRRILTAFERAEATSDLTEQASLLTFLVVGGGPTGVELAGAIAELARFGMDEDFRSFDPKSARVILVQSATRLLPTFPESLSSTAHRSLQRLGVQILLGSRVEDIDANGVAVNGERIAARTVLWAAGVAASPAARWLDAPADGAGRIHVDAQLRVPALCNVFAVGDTCLSLSWRGQAVPGLAPAAKQAGAYVARQIRASLEGGDPLADFRYRHLGSLATIGRKSAVVDLGFLKVWGAPAWWLWGIVHLGFLLGIRNRLSTLVNWFWAYLKFGGGIRLITGAKT